MSDSKHGDEAIVPADAGPAPKSALPWLFPLLAVALVAAVMLNVMKPEAVHLDEDVWVRDVDAAMAEATAERPVLAFFTADWCGPCQSFKKNTLSDPAVAGMLGERVVPLYVDLTERGADTPASRLAAEHGVNQIPTLILLSPGGEALARGGPMDVGTFERWIADGVGAGE